MYLFDQESAIEIKNLLISGSVGVRKPVSIWCSSGDNIQQLQSHWKGVDHNQQPDPLYEDVLHCEANLW